jgi:hypothetical protein
MTFTGLNSFIVPPVMSSIARDCHFIAAATLPVWE